MSKKAKVLLIAEAANPELVSVPLVGWNIAKALREIADVHIVTQVRNLDAIVRAGLVEGVDFTSIDTEAIAAPLWKASEVLRMGKGKGWTTVSAIGAISYKYFERQVWKRFGADIRAKRFDIVHRVTPLSPTISSFIAPRCRKAGVPFVMGPLNGGVPWPKGFDSERRQEQEWLSYVRSAYKLLPGRQATLAAASAIIVGSHHTESEIPDQYRDKCFYLPENGIDPDRFSASAKPGQHTPLKGCFLGRMVPYKGPDMLLEAAAPLLKAGRLTLDMVGDGPMLDDLKAMADRMGVGSAVTFHGWLDHRKVQDVLCDCDLLTFPSIREFGGGVVLEAMALGVPSLIVDYAGPGELVEPDRGIKVAIGPRSEIVSELASALQGVVDDPAQLAVMGKTAKSWTLSNFTWARKAEQISSVHDWVLGRHTDRPQLL